MFYLVGIVVTFFLAALLISKKGKTAADRILALWLLCIGTHLTGFYLFISGRIYEFPHLLGLQIPFPLLHGPLLYLYTGAVTNQIRSARYAVLHFVPFFFVYALILPFIVSPVEHKIQVFENKGAGYETINGAIILMVILSGIVYVALSLLLLAKHKRAIRDQFSNAEKINLAWLRYLIYGIGAVWVMVIFGSDSVIYSTVVVFVIMLGYFGINQVGIFTQPLPVAAIPESKPVSSPEFSALPDSPPPSGLEVSVMEPRKLKYQKSGLSEEAAENIHHQLSQVMSERKLYTNPELTLAQLAQALHVHPNNLSQVINTYEHKAFYDYINLKRVEEFKSLVAQPGSQKFTLLGLANNCGFNSKTSFNRNFKNTTGLSPTEYLRQANIQLVE